MLWFGMIFTPLLLIFMLNANGAITINLMGLNLGTAPGVIGVLFAALSLALVVWEYRVLVRTEVRQLFGLPGTGTPNLLRAPCFSPKQTPPLHPMVERLGLSLGRQGRSKIEYSRFCCCTQQPFTAKRQTIRSASGCKGGERQGTYFAGRTF